jgi:hypothetical protein
MTKNRSYTTPSAKDKALDALEMMQTLEFRLRRNRKLKEYRIKNCIVESTFTEEESPMVNYLKKEYRASNI